MSELTKEYLDKALKPFATKQDLEALSTKDDIRNAVDELARIVNDGFQAQQDFLIEKLDVTERVGKLEKDVHQIKEALHIKQ